MSPTTKQVLYDAIVSSSVMEHVSQQRAATYLAGEQDVSDIGGDGISLSTTAM